MVGKDAGWCFFVYQLQLHHFWYIYKFELALYSVESNSP